MRGRYWTQGEIERFLKSEAIKPLPAHTVARVLERSVPSIHGMRRKLKRLRALGVIDRPELAQLLGVSDYFIQHHSLAQIRRRSEESKVPVRDFLRRGRLYGRPGLVRAHKRNREEA